MACRKAVNSSIKVQRSQDCSLARSRFQEAFDHLGPVVVPVKLSIGAEEFPVRGIPAEVFPVDESDIKGFVFAISG